MTSTGWQQRLEWASTTQEVLQVVNDFLSLWTVEETARIPEDYRLVHVGTAQEVNVHAYKLAHRQLGTEPGDPLTHRMASFFTKAALRMMELSEPGEEAAKTQQGKSS
jgi:hypothetical protein